jgi:ATP-dependent Lhr-like helicase
MSEVFYRLAPYIREYIYNEGWNELREIQGQAIAAILDDDRHVLISSGTASGKTEAAFFPILSQLEQSSSQSVAILYIGPLKALINDQFQRLETVLENSHFKITKWHGDVPASHKKRLLDHPAGILQITPESLEAMMIRNSGNISKLFCDLRYVVIDEVHAFMGTDRGGQLLCQLKKIEKWAGCSPRRIGLSATLGNTDNAETWISSGTEKGVNLLVEQATKKRMKLAIDWYQCEADELEGEEKTTREYLQTLYKWCSKSKSIIFANSRGEAEYTIANMRNIARKNGQKDIFHVHHGNISKLLRFEAEDAMRESAGPTVTAATMTLELGIDLGKLERILQIGAPYSSASFLQRLGRSGRRTGVSEMYFSYLERINEVNNVLDALPWPLLQMIAIIQLYIEERWIEPIDEKKLPYSLLYHQTMSMLASMGELRPSELARNVLSLPPFLQIPQADYKVFLKYLLEINHIEQTEENTLIVGLKGEPLINHFSFYSVFPDEDECKVWSDGKEIGSVNSIPPLNSALILAGKFWQVEDVDVQKKLIYVKPAKKASSMLWKGSGGELHSKIVMRMKQVLTENIEYPYLLERAALRLKEARSIARKSGILEDSIIRLSNESYLYIPWQGSKIINTLALILNSDSFRKSMKIHKVISVGNYGFAIYSDLHESHFKKALYDCLRSAELTEKDIDEKKIPYINKYDFILPTQLLVKQYLANEIDIPGVWNLCII